MKSLFRAIAAAVADGKDAHANYRQLVSEAHRLVRPCRVLVSQGTGDVAGRWYGEDLPSGPMAGLRRWMSFRLDLVPGIEDGERRIATVYTSTTEGRTSEVVLSSDWPDPSGTPLFAVAADSFPPLEALGEYGVNLPPNLRKTSPGSLEGRSFEEEFIKRHPFHSRGPWAILGGWNIPWEDEDWLECSHQRLLLTTVAEPEPWLEVYQLKDGTFTVKERFS